MAKAKKSKKQDNGKGKSAAMLELEKKIREQTNKDITFNIGDRKFSVTGTKEKVQIKDTFVFPFTEPQLVGFANSISDAVKAEMFGEVKREGKPIPFEFPIHKVMFEFLAAGLIGAIYLMFTVGIIGNVANGIHSFWQFLLMLISWGILTLIVRNIYNSIKRKFGINNIYQLIFREDLRE